jgi:uncharacterized protein (DUF1015 family)
MNVKPFRALRPTAERAAAVAALPYDVMNREEAARMTEGNPYSFLHVDKAEIDLPDVEDIYDSRVYARAKENLEGMIADGIYQRDLEDYYYIYRLTMNGRAQTGVVCCPSVDDYLEGRIKKHELTRAEKEEDRVRHVDTLDANTGPIFLAHRPSEEMSAVVRDIVNGGKPVYDFIGPQVVRHEVWVVDAPEQIARITTAFAQMDALYIADGHHRCASAVRVAGMRRAENPDWDGSEEFNFFLAVVFSSDELHILDYNRVVRDLGGLSVDAFLKAVGEKFEVHEHSAAIAPVQPHTFGMYIGGETWYLLVARPGTWDASDPVAGLDVSILQENLLGPLLGIGDPRTDKRIDFVGGIRGLDELVRRAESDMQVAFSMHPTSLDELMAIADAGQIMPPKSTWFEPKLLSGIFVHFLR